MINIKRILINASFPMLLVLTATLILSQTYVALGGVSTQDHWVYLPVIQTIRPDEWAKRFTGVVEVNRVLRTKDGGFLFTGDDSEVMKIASDFEFEWRFMVDTSEIELYLLQGFETSIGELIVAGVARARWRSVGGWDIWVEKLDVNGNPLWQKTLGGSEDEGDYGFAVAETPDGGIVVATFSSSFGSGDADGWVFKLNSDGTVAWQKRVGSSDSDTFRVVAPTVDGGYILAGGSDSGTVGGTYVARLNSDGEIAWQRIYKATTACGARSIQQLSNGDFIIAGEAWPLDWDGCILRLNPDGSLAWWRNYSGENSGYIQAIREIPSEGILALGSDWLVKINNDGEVLWSKSSDQVYFTDIVEIQSDSMILGGETRVGPGGAWLLKLSGEGEAYNCDLIEDLPITSQGVVGTAYVANFDENDTSVSPIITPIDNEYRPGNTIDVCPMSTASTGCR